MDNLSGMPVRPRPLRDEDWDFIASLVNDLRTQARRQRLPPSLTPGSIKESFEKRFGCPNAGMWGIETRDGKLAGYITYLEKPVRMKSVIAVSTGFEYWGKGYAQEAMELVMRFLFEERGLQTVMLWTQSGRVRMVELAKKPGFRFSVRTRESAVMSEGVHDSLLMDILREEYSDLKGLKLGMMDPSKSLTK